MESSWQGSTLVPVGRINTYYERNKMIFVGIDPGVTGAIAAVDEKNNVILLEDYSGDEVKASKIISNLSNEAILDYKNIAAAIEDVHLIPGWGAKGGALMENKGIWKGILAALCVSIKEVKPKVWQQGLFKRTDGSKSVKRKNRKTGQTESKVVIDTQKAGLTVARRMFPKAELHLKKHHNRAAALLIADWLRREFVGGE